MAIFIHCPTCNERLEQTDATCRHCGAELPPGVLYALSAASGDRTASVEGASPDRLPPHLTPGAHRPPAPPPHDLPPRQNSALRPWLAATLSLLCGLGQFYNGQIVKGIVFVALGAAAMMSWRLPIGKFFVPVVWLYAMLDAYVVARRSVPGTR